MNKNTYFRLSLLLILSIISLNSYSSNEKIIIYNSYINDNMGVWKKTIDVMHFEAKKDNQRELELLNYEYGYIGWCIGNKRFTEAKQYINRSKARMSKLNKIKANIPIIHAYQSAYYGFEIGLNKLKAPFVGPKSIEEAKKSISLDKSNYFGYIQLGNIEYYMPSAFGGSKKKALEYYIKAKQIMDKSKPENDWTYINLIAIIGMTYQELNNFKKADEYYKLALKISPEFKWVKNELYPQLLKKQN
jgi:tetratricopeptide (TPR) repeat protein